MRIRTPQDLGLILRQKRRQLGLSQTALAVRVGVSRQWLVGVEQGKPTAEIGLILRTFGALGLSISIETSANISPAIDLDRVVDAATAQRR